MTLKFDVIVVYLFPDIVILYYAFSALTLLVGHQEEHLAC